MFSEDEALALVLGLLVVRQSGLAGTPADVEGALGKVERVMPDSLRVRVRALQEAVVLTGTASDTPPAGAIIAALSEAAHRQRRIHLRYRSRHGEETARLVDVEYEALPLVTLENTLAVRVLQIERQRFLRPVQPDEVA